MKRSLFLSVMSAIVMAACNNVADTAKEASEGVQDSVKTVMAPKFDGAKLAGILAAQSDKAKARYDARHPQETLEFFGIAPGMKVADALPGGGWYSKILIPYLGDFLEKKKRWAAEWVEGAQDWRAGSEGKISAFTFGARDTAMDGQIDAVLFVRALHNLARFDDKGGYLTEALGDAHALLKSGGVVGVVQHQGPETNDDIWANGSKGYLKKSQLIAKFEAAGFKFVKDSSVNENPKDVPSNEDIVWRLPPSLGTSTDNPELKAKMEEKTQQLAGFLL